MPPATPRETVDQIVALRREIPDMATAEIAEELGISPQTVVKWLKRNGLDYGWKRPAKGRALEIEVVDRYTKRMQSGNQIAAELNVSRAGVFRILGRYGVLSRPRGSTGAATLSHQEQELTRRLYEEEKLSHREIARLVGRHESSVKTRLERMGVPSRTRSEAVSIGQRRAYARLSPEERARRTGEGMGRPTRGR